MVESAPRTRGTANYHLRLGDEIVVADDGHVTQVHGLDCDVTTVERNLVFVDLTDLYSPCRIATL